MATPSLQGPIITRLDRLTMTIAPKWTLGRIKARTAMDVWQRHYDAASHGRRTSGWKRTGGDANAVIGPAIRTLREHARELVRNNAYAESAVSTICDHTVGWGITAKPKVKNEKALAAWKAWAESTDCDADGRHDLYGLQKLVMRTVVESGEVLIRRRYRLPGDGFALPMQIQVLDPDFIDTTKDDIKVGTNGRIIQGVEYDGIGRRVAYWLFRDHPGSTFGFTQQSVRVPADGIRHIFRPQRPGQARGLTWFAAVLMRFKDFDEFEDATLVKQKISACLTVLTQDTSGSGAGVGEVDDTQTPPIDNLQPGWIGNVPAGRTITVVNPPTVREYPDYIKTNLRAIATGIGVSYEDLTGDYTDMPFSAARMSRLRHWARVEDWRWRILIPQFCDPVWDWAMQAAAIMGQAPVAALEPRWTAPPPPMIDPQAEGLAYMRNIRAGLITLYEAIRERGYDPDEFFEEYAAGLRKLDELGILLDSDARQTSQAGLTQARTANTFPPKPGIFHDEKTSTPAATPDNEPEPEPEPEPTPAEADERRVRVGPLRITA